MYSVKDDGSSSHRVSPFGYLRVNAFFQLTEAFRRFRVLPRLLMPRHPPAALTSLTKIYTSLSIEQRYYIFLVRIIHPQASITNYDASHSFSFLECL